MSKDMFHANYSQGGLGGLLKEGGTKRRTALTETIDGVGGSVEAFYYAFGDTDLYIIADLPDDATATAVSLNIGAAGVLSVRVTKLIAPETVDEAAGQNVPYRVPGA